MNAAELAERLGGRKNGRGWMAHCPAHEDHNPSLSINDGSNGKLLVKCHAGCTQEAVIKALGAKGLGLGAPPRGYPIPSGNHANVQPPGQGSESGLTLAQYAEAKRLPIMELRKFGLTDISYMKAPAVRIAYTDEAGNEIPAATRFRVALSGHGKVRSKSGGKPTLYGRHRIAKAKLAGYIILPEGESDCHTLWHHGLHAAGLPGADSWREEWNTCLEGIAIIYVIIEPDQGGEAVKRWVSKSAIRDRVRLVTLAGAKDPSDLYLADPDHFREHMEAALAAAMSWQDFETAQAKASMAAAWEKCADLARLPDILTEFARDVAAAGLAGERRVAKLMYLVVSSRLLDRPVSAGVKGTSSGGKSHTTGKVLNFFPPTAYYALS